MNDFPYGIQNFDIELNTFCNARCSYCRIFNQKEINGSSMSEEVLFNFYSRLCNNPPRDYYNIDFAETEPLLSFDLIKKAFQSFPIERENRFFHSITTNGKALNEEILDFCYIHKIPLKISIDGTPENCLKEKGIILEDLKQLCKKAKNPRLIAFSYVITQERLKYLTEDLESLYNCAEEVGCEWTFLLNVLKKWSEDNFNLMIKIVSNFLLSHNNPYQSPFLKYEKRHEPRMNGISLSAEGKLGFMPANHTCRIPIDKFFSENFSDGGTIFNPNNEKFYEYLQKYGQDYSSTSFINKNCDSCACKNWCNIQDATASFEFSDEDCQCNIYNERITAMIKSLIPDYSEIKQDIALNGVCLGLTNQCNMRCRYCFTHPNKEDMSLSTAISSIMWIKENQGKTSNTHVNFFGGEPMLHFEDIIVPLVEWKENVGIDGISFGMTTNGTLLTEDRVKWCHQHNLSILLSIDGGPRTQNYNRVMVNGEDSFNKVIENIPAILAYYPEVTFRSTVYPDTVEDMYLNYLWAEALGFKSFFLMPDEFSTWSKEKTKIFAEQLVKIYWHMYTQIQDSKNPPIILNFFDTILAFFGITFKNKEKPWVRCGLGITSLGIGTNGDIYGCQEHLTYGHSTPFFIGNIFKGGIDENRHKRLISMYLNGDDTSYEGCPSHCYGVNKDLRKRTEIFKVWKGTTQSAALEILKFDAKQNNKNFFNFVSNYKIRGL